MWLSVELGVIFNTSLSRPLETQSHVQSALTWCSLLAELNSVVTNGSEQRNFSGVKFWKSWDMKRTAELEGVHKCALRVCEELVSLFFRHTPNTSLSIQQKNLLTANRNPVTITHHISRHTWRRILHLRCHMCPLGRRYWSRYANLMCLLSCGLWMAAKPQTGKVGHGDCSQSGEWKAGKHLSIKASVALKMMRPKTRGCLSERSPDRWGQKINWNQIAHKSDFSLYVLCGRGSCWRDMKNRVYLGNICPLAKN